MKRAAIKIDIDYLARVLPLLEKAGLKISALVSDPFLKTVLVSISGDALPEECREDELTRFVVLAVAIDCVDGVVAERIDSIKCHEGGAPGSVRDEVARLYAQFADMTKPPEANRATIATDSVSLRIARLHLTPLDVLVVKAHQKLSQEAAQRIRDHVTPLIPYGARVFVIDQDVDLSVLTHFGTAAEAPKGT